MPKVVVADRSFLLTPEGWLPCNRAKEHCAIAGIDRYGKAAPQSVTITRRDSEVLPVFFGTSQCCGVFAPATTVQDVAGSRLRVADLVRDGLIGDLKFETLLSLDEMRVGPVQIEQLWEAICIEAALSDIGSAAIKCRGKNNARSGAARFGVVEQRDQRAYYKITKTSIKNVGQLKSVLEEISGVFRNDNDVLEFDRGGMYLPMAIATAWSASRSSYEFSYDSLQHTSTISLRSLSREDVGLGRGRCINVLGQPSGEWELSWATPRWSPICNGLILASG